MSNIITRILPQALKNNIINSGYWNRLQANQLALSSKRLDICAAQFAHILHLSKCYPLEGKVCFEVGAGWVLSHALICYLLGAKKVIVTDKFLYARPEALSLAVRNSVDSILRDILAPFSEHARIRERFDKLASINRFSFERLNEIGIEYISPFDPAKNKLSEPVDFIYSFSVFEHVHQNDIPLLLRNLVDSLAQGGAMIHCIHLEDHKNFKQRPFDFLNIPESRYLPELQLFRGNRIRFSGWKSFFNELKGTSTDFIYVYSRLDKKFPEAVDPSIRYFDNNDLAVSHIGAFTRKK
jgi:hypothetical protein